ncbi:hypothetical protein RCO48_26415 [Peribacillus frigoritolerans]|nr:hypothetical protein [Peribacillus frigoritolerans]
MIGAGVRDSCGNSESKGDPQAQVRRGRTARGKRVPGGNVQFVQAKKNCRSTYIEFCLQSKASILDVFFFDIKFYLRFGDFF